MHRLEYLLQKGVSYQHALVRSTVHQKANYKLLPESMRVISVFLVLSLLCGVLFYSVYRSDAFHWILLQIPWVGKSSAPAVILPVLPTAFYQSFPSLVSGFSVVLFVALLRPASKFLWFIASTVAITTLALLELFLGYAHWLDMAATILGMLAGLSFVCVLIRRNSVQVASLLDAHKLSLELNGLQPIRARQSLFAGTAVVVFSSLLAVGSTFSDGLFVSECARYSEDNYCEEYKQGAQPVYMSYAKLRSSVVVESPRAPDRIGRLYLYGDYVFLNEVNEGIHIIDNTEPTAPVNLAFIRIPGNTEIAVRNNYLYADSYVDLITLDINDPKTLNVIGREQFIFPYDSYQNIPQNVTFTGTSINRDQGVVVSYRLAGS